MEYVTTSIRLPENIHAAISEQAKREWRSFNAQLVMYLEAKLIDLKLIDDYEYQTQEEKLYGTEE